MIRTILSGLRRRIFEPLYYATKGGSVFLDYWKKLEDTQFFSETFLLSLQWARFVAMLEYAYQSNQFYQSRFNNHGINPADIKIPENVSRLPILTKQEIRQAGKDMISRGFEPGRLLRFKTGGSTGKPLEIYITEECSELRIACARRHDRWTGWEVGQPIGAVWGNPVLPVDLKSRLRNCFLTPTIYLDTMKVNEKSVREFARRWEAVKPTLLFGHAHSIFVLADFVRTLNIDSIRPKNIISSSMMLLPNERKKIEQVFGVKVFDRYGCEEVSLIASECERHEGMHLNIEHLFIEFVNENGEYVKPGEPGKIIVTDLMNRAMPLIRYQLEDVGVPSDQKCSCGRGLPMMEKVIGRVADFLIKKDGSRVAGVSLIENTLTRIPGIEQMQIIQEALDWVTLNIVPGKCFSQQEELRAYFEKLFEYQASVEIRLVEEIKPEESGKYRFSVCKVKSV